MDPTQLCDSDGIIWSSSRIKGNNYGMARVIYREPVLFSRNARFVIHQIGEEGIHLHMTKQLSQVSSVFELYPMSTDPLYDHLNIESSDGSARRIMSGNGNIWLTGDIQPESQQDIQVLFHQGWFQRPRSGCLYLFDKQITRIQSTWPVIIGAITLQVRVYDEENVSQVSFYQDETCLGKDSKPPFHQIWDERTKGPVELSFQVNYVDGTRVKKTISVLKLV